MDAWQAGMQIAYTLRRLRHLNYPSRTSQAKEIEDGELLFRTVYDTTATPADIERSTASLPFAVVKQETSRDDADDPDLSETTFSIAVVARSEASYFGSGAIGAHRPDGMFGSRGRGVREILARVRRRFRTDGPDTGLTVLSIAEGQDASYKVGDSVLVSGGTLRLRVVTFAEPSYPPPHRLTATGSPVTVRWFQPGWDTGAALLTSTRFDLARFIVRGHPSAPDPDEITVDDGTGIALSSDLTTSVQPSPTFASYAVFAMYRPYGTAGDEIPSRPAVI